MKGNGCTYGSYNFFFAKTKVLVLEREGIDREREKADGVKCWC